MADQVVNDTLRQLRRFLLILLVGGVAVTLAELLLSGHTEDIRQLIPVVLLVSGLPAIAVCAKSNGAPARRVLMVLLVAYFVSGMVGVYLHFAAKIEFALEGQPDLGGWALFVEALAGSSPPILAPLAMSGLALLGFVWNFRNPTQVTS